MCINEQSKSQNLNSYPKQGKNGYNNKATVPSDEAFGSLELVNHPELTYLFGASQWLGQETVLITDYKRPMDSQF